MVRSGHLAATTAGRITPRRACSALLWQQEGIARLHVANALDRQVVAIQTLLALPSMAAWASARPPRIALWTPRRRARKNHCMGEVSELRACNRLGTSQAAFRGVATRSMWRRQLSLPCTGDWPGHARMFGAEGPRTGTSPTPALEQLCLVIWGGCCLLSDLCGSEQASIPIEELRSHEVMVKQFALAGVS